MIYNFISFIDISRLLNNILLGSILGKFKKDIEGNNEVITEMGVNKDFLDKKKID